jgi:SAM-dependent methyltransferase
VRDADWNLGDYDAVFTANTLHIMSWIAVESLLAGLCQVLRPGGYFCIYGPFRYAGAYTAPSNAAFDQSLRARDPDSGIRDFEAVDGLARQEGLLLVADHAMPANNQLLVWQRECD